MEMEIESIHRKRKVHDYLSYLSTFTNGLHAVRHQFCDATLLAGGKIFQAHKVILAANSRYFYSIFVHNFNERESAEIKMPMEINALAMEALLNFFYTGELELSQENIESVFWAIDYMRLEPLLDICIEYIRDSLDPSNCLQYYVMAEMVQFSSPRSDGFKKAASALIVREIVTISECEDFLNLNVEFISKILMWSNHAANAEAMYMTILKWVGHDEENRRQFLCNLLQMLPIDAIKFEFYDTTMKNEELLQRDPKSISWLLDTFGNRIPALFACQNTASSLFIADRWSRKRCFHVNIQNPTPLALGRRPKMSHMSAVSHKEQIYLLCGSRTYKSYRLNDPQGSWTDCELDLKFGIYNAGCIVLGDDLFVIGGSDWTDDAFGDNSVMKFNFGSGRKEVLPGMVQDRTLPGVAVYANSVYAVCGDEESSIERFDPREGQWRLIEQDGTSLIGQCCSATVADYLYACDVDYGAIERFDFRAYEWEGISDLPSSTRKAYWITSVGDDLYGAVGGCIFKYDVAADQWNPFCSGMDIKRPIIVPWF